MDPTTILPLPSHRPSPPTTSRLTSPTNSNNNSSNNTNNHIEHPSPSHSNDAQSPIHGDNDPHILSNAGVPSSNALQSPQGHPTSLLPMPSPALAAATAANTSANSNP